MRVQNDPIFSKRKRHHWVRNTIGLLLAIVALSGLYSAMINSRVLVKTQKIFIPDLPAALEGFTVLHISDLNGTRFGPGQQQIATALKAQKYNAVCITGNMTGAQGDAFPFYDLLAALDQSKPVFFIAGGDDPVPVGGQAAGYYTVLADWVAGAQMRGAVYLDAPASVKVGTATVWFSNAAQISLDLDATAAAYAAAQGELSRYYQDVIDRTRAARLAMHTEDLHLSLSHMPFSADTASMIQRITDADGASFLRSVDLLLSGGTLGGQWRLPFVGPVWANQWFPPARDVLGYRYTGSLLQYTSGGLGASRSGPLPAFRLFNAPEMTLLTFTTVMDENSLAE